MYEIGFCSAVRVTKFAQLIRGIRIEESLPFLVESPLSLTALHPKGLAIALISPVKSNVGYITASGFLD